MRRSWKIIVIVLMAITGLWLNTQSNLVGQTTTAPATRPAAGAGAAATPGRGRAARGGGRAPAQLPPLGNPIADADRQELQTGVDKLAAQIAQLRGTLKGPLADRLADVEIYLNAVRYPLVYNELINVQNARKALGTGQERATQLAAGQTPWTTQDGPRGYYSRIDGSAQPFLLNVPVGFKPDDARKYRLDAFCHGRSENMMELSFMYGPTNWNQRPTAPAADRFILQPYGRWCNANRFAGDIDAIEAIDALKKEYAIDENRIVMTGFSMGGASAWQYSTHYSDLWAATSAGAGFSETHDFLNLRADPVWYEKTLWHMYDSIDYAVNLFDVPMVAYAGEIDPQKQSSDAMLKSMDAEGLKLERIIGPGVGHTYEPGARDKLAARLDELAARGRDPSPKEIRFTTWTLRYNHMFWVVLDGLEKHWDRARADAKIDGDTLTLKTSNVTAMHLDWAAGLAPWKAGAKASLQIDGETLPLPAVAGNQSLRANLTKTAGHWQIGAPPTGELRKRPGLQGPIDDAFLDAFLVVRPTGQPINEAVGKWTASEADRAIRQWHSIFRGEARVKNDADVTDADMAANNLILFGDPSSNAVLKRVADQLAIKWTAKTVTAGGQTFSADTHVPVFIYPNPLNPAHYVVINSGFTFHDHSNNARQTSKLPDWAIVNTAEPGTVHIPAAIEAAGFFDEAWKVKNEN